VLLRLLYAEAAETRAARLVETRELLEGLDRDRSSASPVGVELDLHAKYAGLLLVAESMRTASWPAVPIPTQATVITCVPGRAAPLTSPLSTSQRSRPNTGSRSATR
jgi:hypothetical protein